MQGGREKQVGATPRFKSAKHHTRCTNFPRYSARLPSSSFSPLIPSPLSFPNSDSPVLERPPWVSLFHFSLYARLLSSLLSFYLLSHLYLYPRERRHGRFDESTNSAFVPLLNACALLCDMVRQTAGGKRREKEEGKIQAFPSKNYGNACRGRRALCGRVELFPGESSSSKNFNYTRASSTIPRVVWKRRGKAAVFPSDPRRESRRRSSVCRTCVCVCVRRAYLCARLERTINCRTSLGQLRSAKLLTRLLCRTRA